MLARVRTPEDGIMAINYATNGFSAEEHTGANVPVYANALGADFIEPFIQQPDLFDIMANHLGLDTQSDGTQE